MVSALTLAGMRLGRDEVKALGKRLRTTSILKDSSFYHVILEEGMEKGRKEGRKEGIEHLSERLLAATSWADLLEGSE